MRYLAFRAKPRKTFQNWADYLKRYAYLLVVVGSSGILKAKQKLGVTFNFNKLGVMDFENEAKTKIWIS